MGNKVSEIKWKNKALERSAEIRRLNKRLGEVTCSRDRWRQKYYVLRHDQHLLARHKPARHHYPTVLIWLCIQVYNRCHCSYRNCCEMVITGALIFKINCRRPSASTIRNWMIKYGYYHYYHQARSSGKWAVVVDESVSIGQEKLLLVLGVPLEGWTFERPIKHKDVHVLHISMATSWKAEPIAEILKDLSERFEISYCISDKGNNIMGALKQAGCYHVYDCSHQWAKLMENLYGRSKDFLRLMSAVSMLRRQWVLSKYAHLMPPAVRSKSRFQNIFPVIRWAEKMCRHWHLLERTARGKLSFLKRLKGLIMELIILKQVITKMSQLLKKEGLSKATTKKCKQILRICQKGRPLEFKTRLKEAWKLYQPRLDNNEKLLCSSDIIESYFGRFKNKLKSNGMQAITESVLTMGGWATDISRENIQTALTKVYIKQIEEWKKENTTPSISKKRHLFFNKNCTKTHMDF